MGTPLRIGAALAALALLAAVPLVAGDYALAFMINLVSFVVLSTAWALFSGTTRYISLATSAFFGIGAYAMALFGEALPYPLALAVAAGAGIIIALVVGLSTLRLSGIHFTIFTFGLSELIRQVTIWCETTYAQSVGRYIFLDISQAAIYWRLLALAAVLFALGARLMAGRAGLALRTIGADETVARHCGIDTTRAKVLTFALSAAFMALTGAIMAPRWTYIDPSIAFKPEISFQVLIMALLGGAGRLWGPVLGVVPMLLLSELLQTRLPSHYIILLGLCFMAIVYFIPDGLAGLLGRMTRRRERAA
jgi:branched-chain amino acid transport system permease protein